MALALVAGVAAVAAGSGTAEAAAQRGLPDVQQNVIVVLQNQHTDLAIAKGHSSPRVDANHKDQTGLIAKARSKGASNLRGFDTVNAVAATVTPEQAADLAADPSVAAIFPDLPIRKGPQVEKPTTSSAGSVVTNSQVCPTDPAKPMLQPEALQLTNTAFDDPSKPQAQKLVDGTGVKVGWIADGIDINNPDFIRADGSHVFVDYQDFSGDGPNAVTGGAEAFGDASSIAAQGRQVYDLSQFVNPAHPLPPGCNITVRGMAPGASLVGLKVFGNAPTAPTSRFIQAIDYAVNTAQVDVLNESFGGNPFPDNNNDPIAIADNAAVDAGVTVVASTGDAGTNGTSGTPSTSEKVIGVAGTTSFQSYAQTSMAGFQLSNGKWVSDNISGLSSGGVSQQARVPDLSAPGDLGWALCTPDPERYEECFDNKGAPSPIQNFGGTSQSSPLVAGAAALVVQAYKNTHGGVRPAPALVKRLLTSTATDLGHPAFEQGAGIVNSLAAVQAAMSWKDGNGSPAVQGNALVVDQTQLSVIGNPNSVQVTTLKVTNVSNQVQVVRSATRTMGKPVTAASGTVNLNIPGGGGVTYLDATGVRRTVAAQTFTVPANRDRLDVSAAASAPPGFALRIILIDPNGVYEAYSIPQGFNNFAHIDVRFPVAGTWTAYVGFSTSSKFNGGIQFLATTSNFVSQGIATPVVLAPGATGTVAVVNRLPAQPSDLSASVQLSTNSVTTSVPLTLRAVVPARNTTFTGVITGGNGRQQLGPAQTNIYYLDVPAGKRDLTLSVTFPDPNMIVLGTLTSPEGQVSSFMSNADVDATNNLVTSGGMSLFRRDPRPGRWVFSFEVTNPVSGLQVSQPFTATVAYDSVKIKADFPNNAKTKLKAGAAVDVPVTVTNTGVVPLTFFSDGRLDTMGDIPLANVGTPDTIPLPQPPGVNPEWVSPPETTKLTFASTADQPVNLDVFYNSGEPDVYQGAQGNGATVKVSANAVSPGLWIADVGQSGPFSDAGAPPGQVTFATTAHAKLFDPGVSSNAFSDVWTAFLGSSGSSATTQNRVKAGAGFLAHPGTTAAKHNSGGSTPPPSVGPGPVTLNPGETVVLTVTITPSAPAGTVVHGHVYIDDFNFFTAGGDELIDFPYAYTVG